MVGYKIQLKDKNGNLQYPVSTTNVVVDADGVSVADLLDRKQPTLVSGVNIKTINGKTLLGEGDLVIEGGTADLSGYATEEYVDAKVGESYPIYYSYDGTPLTEEQKAANKTAVDKYAENESVILYPYNSSVGHPFDVMLTLSEGAWKTAELTNYLFAYFNDDGTTMHYVKVTVGQDGDVQVEFSAQSPLVLASKAYVDSKVGGGSSDDSYPLYIPMSDDEVLTSAQLAANKAAYDAVMSEGAQPVLYFADGGKSMTAFMSEGFPFEGRAVLVGSYPYGMDDTGAFMLMVGFKVDLMSDGTMQNLTTDFYGVPSMNVANTIMLPEVVFFLPLVDGGTLQAELQAHNAKSVKVATTYGCRAWTTYNGIVSTPATVVMLDPDEGLMLQVLSATAPNQGTTDLSVKASWYAINLDGSVVKQA